MKTVVLLSLSLAVALGVPVLPPDVVQHPDKDQSPLLGDRVPVQGHVVVENSAPQISPSSDKNPQTPEDLKLKENMNEEKPEVKAEPEVKVENTEPEMEEGAEPDLKVESEVKEELNVVVEMVEVKPEVEELEPDDLKVESEAKVEPDVQSEEPEEPYEAHPAMVKSVDETEGRPEPVMESEPLNDDDDDDDLEEKVNQKELSDEEMSVRQEDFVAGNLPEEEEDLVEEEEELLRKRDVLEEQPVMELEPEMMGEAEPIPVEDEEPVMEQLSESYLPEEEAQMKMFVREGSREDEVLQIGVIQQAMPRVSRQATGGSNCPGIFIGGKCYQFFSAAKNYADAEFFCQEQFSGGHLASITSLSTHRDVMNLILMQNGGYTRTWVGGRRLDDHRFVWLDGSRWTYDDWLSGEPNNTAGVEDCVEVLDFGNGKFNDFTCWEPQAFICSYPYQ